MLNNYLFAILWFSSTLMLQACAPIARQPSVQPTEMFKAKPQPAANARNGLTAAEKQEMVGAHNKWRDEVGVPPVTWSATVAAVAQKWAETLAAQGGQLQHNQDTGYGENLFGGSGKRYTPTEAVNSWGS